MTTESANIRTRNFKEVIMVPLEWVVMLAWNKECGETLKLLRGKRSRREIADAVSQQGVECSQEYIRKLENGEAASVSTKIIITIAKTLDVELIEIISDLRVEVTKIVCT
ncbi:MAG: helix-turn-helix domain-containing protein [Aulosira sp. ZfuVER01]|nr:helix-turn-helix transcriptional regulator [Aulosira sp. ZfuVER01]MDZ7997617.1 helix-turn-helix transcriptional regulator [Aulosira sp. DedVER01a]MDZ8054619.1 helix-turn-helix transcriptional regulator [Aulosira sp. ZfuCHP01]